MKRFVVTLACAGLAVAISSVMAQSSSVAEKAQELREMAVNLFQPIPGSVTEVRGQAISQPQITLGKALYFDPRLSRSQTISCNSCHNLGTAGVDNASKSIGHNWQRGDRNSPTVLNAVFNAAQFWDGRAADLKEQAKGPLVNPVEMNSTEELVESTLRSIPGYADMFRQAFPSDPQPVTFDNAARAIEAFETTLITPNSKFDQFLQGSDTAMNAQELQGLSLFMEEGCITCHTGVNLGGQTFFPFGLINKPHPSILPTEDTGRAGVTKQAEDDYFFRVAPLRNIALTAPYFHSGQIWDLSEAVSVMSDAQLGQKLSPEDVGAITSFLGTLTGDQPKVEYPLLPPSSGSTPRPD
jgi:cytochrome c peroxidase